MSSAEPIDNVRWLDADSLVSNHYNPNVVHVQELKLLETSILTTGWIQPILANVAGTIIDGFHRWTLSTRSPRLRARYGGRVPVATLDVSEAEAMMMTIRINRAKGTHVALRMSEIVRGLVANHGLDPQEIASGIGATMSEVELLMQDGIFKAKNLDKMPYSRAWVPSAG